MSSVATVSTFGELINWRAENPEATTLTIDRHVTLEAFLYLGTLCEAETGAGLELTWLKQFRSKLALRYGKTRRELSPLRLEYIVELYQTEVESFEAFVKQVDDAERQYNARIKAARDDFDAKPRSRDAGWPSWMLDDNGDPVPVKGNGGTVSRRDGKLYVRLTGGVHDTNAMAEQRADNDTGKSSPGRKTRRRNNDWFAFFYFDFCLRNRGLRDDRNLKRADFPKLTKEEYDNLMGDGHDKLTSLPGIERGLDEYKLFRKHESVTETIGSCR